MTDIAPIRAAATAIGEALRGTKYAIVGGAACVLLGSTRHTLDVDLVVPRGATPAARMALKNSAGSKFQVDARTRHTHFDGVPVEILAPPALFRGEFTDDTPVLEIDGTFVLKPTLLLSAKCGSIWERADGDKKWTDAQDIKFLLQWLIENGCRLSAGTKEREEVPNATKESVKEFVERFGAQSLWADAGITFEE